MRPIWHFVSSEESSWAMALGAFVAPLVMAIMALFVYPLSETPILDFGFYLVLGYGFAVVVGVPVHVTLRCFKRDQLLVFTAAVFALASLVAMTWFLWLAPTYYGWKVDGVSIYIEGALTAEGYEYRIGQALRFAGFSAGGAMIHWFVYRLTSTDRANGTGL